MNQSPGSLVRTATKAELPGQHTKKIQHRKEVPQEATAPVNKTVIAVLRIGKIVLRILIPQATKALIQKSKNLKRIHIK